MQPFQERFGGWNSSQVVEPFRQYARTMFQAFGNRVKHWTTMNEPQTSALSATPLGHMRQASVTRRAPYPVYTDEKTTKCGAAMYKGFRGLEFALSHRVCWHS